jgi:two-component system, cell cycle sensor histidine kinase and response regulator CckA
MNEKTLVLIVDDDQFLLNGTCRILKKAGYETIQAATGMDALRQVTEHNPDLVLLDVILPDFDGFEVCRRIKADGKLADTYVVLMSSVNVDSDCQASGLEMGADGYIARPVSNREFLARIESLLRLKRSEKALKESELNFRTVANFTHDWEYWISPDGSLRHISPSCERITGYHPDEFIHSPELLRDIVHPDDRELLGTHCTVINSHEPHFVDFRIFTRSGDQRWIEHHCQPVFGAHGEWLGRRISNRDITDRKRIESELRAYEAHLEERVDQITNDLRTSSARLEDLINTTSDWVWEINEKWEYTYASPRMSEVMGYKVEEIMGKTPLDFMTQEEAVRIGDIFGAIADRREPFSFLENTNIDKDGRSVILETSGVPIFGADGTFRGYRGIDRDISNRKRSEEALRKYQENLEQLVEDRNVELRERELIFRSVFENSSDGILFGAPDGTIFIANPMACAILDRTENEICELGREGIVDSTDARIPLFFQERTQDGETRGEINFKLKNGSVVPVELTSKIFMYSEAEERTITIFRDITQRKLAGKALQKSEQTLNSILTASAVGIAFVDFDRTARWVNQSWLDIFGYQNLEEVKGLKEPRVYPSEHEFRRVGNLVSSFCVKGQVAETDAVMMRKNGETFDAHIRINPFDPSDLSKGFVSAIQDISWRKKAEHELMDSKARFEAFMENSPVVAFMKDEQGRFVYANKKWLSNFGLLETDWNGKTSQDIFPPDVAARLVDTDQVTLEQNRMLEYVAPVVNVSGGLNHWWTFKFPVQDTSGRKYVGGVALDISDRLSAEEALRRSEKKFRELAELLPQGVFETDAKGRFTFVNSAFERLHGYSRVELLNNLNPGLLVVRKDRKRLNENIKKTLIGQQLVTDRGTALKKDGSTVPVLVYAAPINENGQMVGVRGIVIDISPLKQAEEDREKLRIQLFQSQKMEALGTLVGGIAHDFNNMLQIIMGYSQLLIDDEKPGKQRYNDLQTIIQTGQEGADLVQKLLAFGQQGQVIPVPLDLNHQLNQLTTLISRTLPQVVQLDLDLYDGPTTIVADHGQIDQLVMSLAINASEAMPDGGALKISTSIVSLDDDYCKSHLEAKPGDYVMLSIRDTGRGMDKETLTRIFDPFFSTKERGSTRGTGLGLSVAQGIVQQQGGHITCESEPGKGTEFKVYFPAIAEPLMSAKMLEPQVQSGTPETILVVEDNVPVAELARRILTNAGYKVVVGANGQEALDIYKTRKGEVSLVILDLLMPEMGGKDCLMELLKIDPSLKVLIASGFSPSDKLHEEISPLVKGFVHKPFGLAQLLKAVESVLRG